MPTKAQPEQKLVYSYTSAAAVKFQPACLDVNTMPNWGKPCLPLHHTTSSSFVESQSLLLLNFQAAACLNVNNKPNGVKPDYLKPSSSSSSSSSSVRYPRVPTLN
ncbi:unnamed protein product [Calypogeia fissa]